MAVVECWQWGPCALHSTFTGGAWRWVGGAGFGGNCIVHISMVVGVGFGGNCTVLDVEEPYVLDAGG